MHRQSDPALMDAALQPDLGLEDGSIDPASETALRAAYARTNWKRRGISCAKALVSKPLRICLRVLAEIAARNAKH